MDPENRAYIAKEQGCMTGLVGYLRSADNEVHFFHVSAKTSS